MLPTFASMDNLVPAAIIKPVLCYSSITIIYRIYNPSTQCYPAEDRLPLRLVPLKVSSIIIIIIREVYVTTIIFWLFITHQLSMPLIHQGWRETGANPI